MIDATQTTEEELCDDDDDDEDCLLTFTQIRVSKRETN